MVQVNDTVGQAISQRPHGSERAGYRQGRAVERVAAVTASRYAPETLDEMKRLAAFLASGDAVRTDVPRGFYFNALV